MAISMKGKMMHFEFDMSCMKFYSIKAHLDDLVSNLGYGPRTFKCSSWVCSEGKEEVEM